MNIIQTYRNALPDSWDPPTPNDKQLTPEHTQRLAYMCADRAIRVFTPIALRRAGLDVEAVRLEALPEIIDRTTARTAAAAAARTAAAAAARTAAAAAAARTADAWAAWAAADAADAAADAAWAAWAAADAAWAAWAADAAARAADCKTEALQLLKDMLG